MFVNRELFGGAITAQTTPDLIDASDVRQVPDTQEVFLYAHSSVSIILEILQRVEPSHFDDAIRFHFDSLAHDNSAHSATVENVALIPHEREDDAPPAIILKGVQMVSKFNRTTPDKVYIFMALFRIDSKAVDLVLTFNVPVDVADGGALNGTGIKEAEVDFHKFVQSLRIVDFGLFA